MLRTYALENEAISLGISLARFCWSRVKVGRGFVLIDWTELLQEFFLLLRHTHARACLLRVTWRPGHGLY